MIHPVDDALLVVGLGLGSVPVLVTVRLAAGFLRTRDPIEGYLALVLLPMAVAFPVALGWQARGGASPVSAAVLNVLGLAVPLLTLLLVAQVHRVPVKLLRAASAGFLIVLVAELHVVVTGDPLLGTRLGFLVLDALLSGVAAGFLISVARVRTVPSSARMWAAATATLLLCALLFVVNVIPPGRTGPGAALTVTLQALSMACYVIAFLPPPWLRRAWTATTWSTVTGQLQTTPANASPDQVWRRYAQVVRSVTAADAVVVLVGRRDGGLDQPVAEGVADGAPTGARVEHLDAMRAANQPIRLDRGCPPAQPLCEHYAARTGSRFVTVRAVTVPPSGTGGLLIFSRYRNLFAADDLRVLADIGGQAGILAERGGIIASQRRLAEELADSVDQLRQASLAKNEFLANMSHELRTPLTAVLGFSDLMRAVPRDGGPWTVPADWADHIHSSGRKLLSLINDVLDLAKAEAGRLDLQPTPQRLDCIVDDLLATMRAQFAEHGLRVTVDVPPVIVNVDPVRFRQLVENLLSNAVKFTPGGGRVSVTGRQALHEVTVTVADTGLGIAVEDHERVFQPFQTVGEPGQRRPGTGLGLALTRQLARAHGGTVTLSSMPGKGSRFTVHVPASVLSPAAPAAGRTVASRSGGRR